MLVLKEVQGFSVEEIAELMEINANTVKVSCSVLGRESRTDETKAESMSIVQDRVQETRNREEKEVTEEWEPCESGPTEMPAIFGCVGELFTERRHAENTEEWRAELPEAEEEHLGSCEACGGAGGVRRTRNALSGVMCTGLGHGLRRGLCRDYRAGERGGSRTDVD